MTLKELVDFYMDNEYPINAKIMVLVHEKTEDPPPMGQAFLERWTKLDIIGHEYDKEHNIITLRLQEV